MAGQDTPGWDGKRISNQQQASFGFLERKVAVSWSISSIITAETERYVEVLSYLYRVVTTTITSA